MRNQTSFRLTTTLLPTDTTAKTTTVINKVDSNGDKFYPTFTEETVVLTNDDRTVMETTRAVCTNGALTFTKRGLSDDDSETQVANRKLTRNPWTLAFITAWAWDWIDKDDDITWSGDQTYTGDMTVSWKATYNWLLETKKGVKYPSFEDVAALEAYANPFGWMFATVDSTWELYRYNAVTEEWSVVTTATPTNPEMADDDTIGTVRVATDAEFAASTDTGASWEYLVATVSQIHWVDSGIKVFTLVGNDTDVWQDILDYVLDWNTPIILYKATASSSPLGFYLTTKTSSRITFTRPYLWGWTGWVSQEAIFIEYSWTTLSNIWNYDNPTNRIVFIDQTWTTDEKKAAAQIAVDNYLLSIPVIVSTFASDVVYYLHLDKRTEWVSTDVLKFATLDGTRYVNITYDNSTTEVTNVTFNS